MYHYIATVERIVDGDTIDVNIDLGLKIHVRERLRLKGINAWETRGEHRAKGLAAKEWLKDAILGTRVEVFTDKDKKGKYGRYVAVVRTEGGTYINRRLVELGHAVEAKY